MTEKARGDFAVKITPASPAPGDGLSRFSMSKELHGDLEATSQGEMLAGGDRTKGAAGYVAIEMVKGALKGRQGSFALQHSGTMDANGVKLQVMVVPGSGAGELEGISGVFTIHAEGGSHTYEFDYTLPH